MKRKCTQLNAWSDFTSFPVIDNSWNTLFAAEFAKPYFATLCKQIRADYDRYKGEIPIFPAMPQVFTAFDLCPLESVKVVIIGQDPYHGVGQAMGLCFSVTPTVKIPPSLRDIYRELERDPKIPFKYPAHGDLTSWATQGVLLLNSSLTVRMGSAGAHSDYGWQQFTDAVIQTVSSQTKNVVFLLWGRHAQDKSNLIDTQKHHILSTSHPSPYSVKRGFEGCAHFSKCNEILVQSGKMAIDWNIPPTVTEA